MANFFSEQGGLALCGVAGMLLFLIVFVTVLVGAYRRPREQVERLAALALDAQDTQCNQE